MEIKWLKDSFWEQCSGIVGVDISAGCSLTWKYITLRLKGAEVKVFKMPYVYKAIKTALKL